MFFFFFNWPSNLRQFNLVETTCAFFFFWQFKFKFNLVQLFLQLSINSSACPLIWLSWWSTPHQPAQRWASISLINRCLGMLVGSQLERHIKVIAINSIKSQRNGFGFLRVSPYEKLSRTCSRWEKVLERGRQDSFLFHADSPPIHWLTSRRYRNQSISSIVRGGKGAAPKV